MSTDITHWSRDCQFCQQAKATRATVQQMPITARRFSHIHLDLVDPLPRSKEGFNYLLMVVDHVSFWLEAFPLESTSTGYIADTFNGGWVACFGVPDHITSDHGPQFCSALWAQLSQRLGSVGTLHHLTTALPLSGQRHGGEESPSAKGRPQGLHRGRRLPSHLPWVLLGLGATPRRIPASLQPSCSTVPLRSFLASFLVCQCCCRRFSTSPQELLYLTSPPGVPTPPGSPQRSLFSSKVLHLFMFVAAVPNCHSHHVQQAIRRGNNKTFYAFLQNILLHSNISINYLY